MLKLHEWVQQAQRKSGLSGAELSRLLYQRLGRDTQDRSLIGKMSKAPGSAGTKPRRTSLEEMIALAEITGFPIPEELLNSLGAFVPAKQIDGRADLPIREEPLKASEVNEPIDGSRAIESALKRIVGLTPRNVRQ